ncbi:MAG: FAD:protein FMN transferase [Bacteroidota bacterium]
MGTPFEISVVGVDGEWAMERVKSAVAEIKRIDKLLTTLSADSQANLINHSAGIAPVKINGELFKLIDRSLKIAELTQGAFDITYGTNLSYRKVELNAAENTVFLKEKSMRIYFGGIAKGYATDRAKYVLQMEGVGSGVINAAGDLITWGLQPDGRQWTIGDADPEQRMKPYSDFNISNMAVATSVNRNEEHPIDNAKSVCVMCTSAEMAGAMTAPVIMLGIKVGTDLINRLQQLACVFVDEYNQMFTSKFMNALN